MSWTFFAQSVTHGGQSLVNQQHLLVLGNDRAIRRYPARQLEQLAAGAVDHDGVVVEVERALAASKDIRQTLLVDRGPRHQQSQSARKFRQQVRRVCDFAIRGDLFRAGAHHAPRKLRRAGGEHHRHETQSGDERRLVPGREREHPEVALAPGDLRDALDGGDLLVAPLPRHDYAALAVEHVLEDLRPENALGLAGAGLPEDVAVRRALALGEVDGLPAPAEEASPRREADEGVARRSPLDLPEVRVRHAPGGVRSRREQEPLKRGQGEHGERQRQGHEGPGDRVL